MAKRSSTTKDLKAENERLAAEVARLNKAVASKNSAKSKNKKAFWKKAAIIFSLGLAGALLVVGNILFWTGHTLVDNDRFIAATSPLIQQPAVQQGVATYATQKIFDNVNVQQTVQNVLPPRADFLAPTISDNLKSVVHSSFQKLLANQKFQDVWTSTLTTAHAKLINYVKNYQGNGTISLQDVYNNLSANFSGTKLAFLAGKPLPSNVGSITIVQASWLPEAHNVVNHLNLYQWLTVLVIVGLSALSIFLAGNRRKMVQLIFIIFSLLMLASLISIRIAQTAFVNHVNQTYQAAAKQAIDVIANPLILQTRVLLLVGLLAAFITWVGGSSRLALASRQRINVLFDGQVHQAIFKHGENKFSLWVGAHKRLLQWLAVLLVAVIMLIVTLSPAVIIWYALLMLVMVLIIEGLAASPK